MQLLEGRSGLIMVEKLSFILLKCVKIWRKHLVAGLYSKGKAPLHFQDRSGVGYLMSFIKKVAPFKNVLIHSHRTLSLELNRNASLWES